MQDYPSIERKEKTIGPYKEFLALESKWEKNRQPWILCAADINTYDIYTRSHVPHPEKAGVLDLLHLHHQ